MSLIDRYSIDEEEPMYNFNTDKKVCYRHIKEPFIRSTIKSNGSKGKCDYCGYNTTIIDLSIVLQIIVTGIDYLFEDPVHSRNLNDESESGFDGGMYFEEMWDELGLEITNYDLEKDVLTHLDNPSFYVNKEEFFSESEYQGELWDIFKSIIKHKARYVFHFDSIYTDDYYESPHKILDHVQESILKFNIFSSLPANTFLFRCRQHETSKELDKVEDFAAPPDDKAKYPGRMNAAGISMFYSSPDKEVTIKEVVDFEDQNRPKYSIATFKTIENIKLLDLTLLPPIPSIYDNSLFNLPKVPRTEGMFNLVRNTELSSNEHISSLKFLHTFVEDILKPVKKSEAEIEYIPTQVFTEYIRYNPKFNVDGILYPSAKDKTKTNVVLFYNHNHSIEKLEFIDESLEIHCVNNKV